MSVARTGWIDQACLGIFAAVAVTLLIGDFGVRLANISTDDGLVAIAYFVKHPEFFTQDLQLQSAAPVSLASMLNWLPALLFKYVGIPPEAFFWLFTYLQNVLLALAMYRLGMVMMRSREVALIAAVFTLALLPHWWNAGLFADLYWMAYGAWLALPFLIYAGAFALEQRRGAAAALLVVGGLIHPILGLFATAMVGAYWCSVLVEERNLRRLTSTIALLGAGAAVFLLPVLLAKLGADDEPARVMFDVVLRNGHAVPWANPDCGYCMPRFVLSLVAVPALTALALLAAWRLPAHPGLRSFLVACAVVAFAACLLHGAAYFAHNATILRVISTRSTILLLAFAVPPAVGMGWHVLSTAPSFAARFFACYVMLLPAPLALVAGVLGLTRAGRAGACLLFAMLLARVIPGMARVLDAAFVPVLYGPWGARVSLFFIAVSASLAWWAGRRRNSGAAIPAAPNVLAMALIAPLIAFLLASNYTAGSASTTGEPRDYYEVQSWARTSTAPDATFVVWETSVYEAWRNYTHRSRISAPSCGVYACPTKAKVEGAKVAAFFAEHGGVTFSGLGNEGLRAFARTFGADYAVRRKSWGALDFPVAYENQAYVVYDMRQAR